MEFARGGYIKKSDEYDVDWIDIGRGYIISKAWLKEYRPDLYAALDRPKEDGVE